MSDKEVQEYYSNLVAALDSNIPSSAVSKRDAGRGTQLSYLEGHYVIDRLNKVVGQGNWAYEIVELKTVYEGKLTNNYGKENFHVSYVSKIKLSVELGSGPISKKVYFIDTGYGDGQDKLNPGKAHELASKEAVTDGIKRCAKNLGQSMGLALYDKSQINVGEPATPTATPSAPKVKKTTRKVAKSVAAMDTSKKSPISPDALRQKVSMEFQILRAKRLLEDVARVEYLKGTFGVEKVRELSDEDIPKVSEYLTSNFANELGA